MKFTVELPLSEYDALISDVQSAIAGMARYKLALKKTCGNAHDNVLAMSAQIARAERGVTALKLARHNAVNPPPPTSKPKQTPARNVGDDMGLVYGRPRNDPRNPRKKIV